MIVGNVDLKSSTLDTVVVRVCDECKKEETTRVRCVLAGRKIRNAVIDLCWHCANSKKYRKIPSGRKHGHWKHGISVAGYRRIFDEERGERVLEHVYVMEKHLGRRMNDGEHIHHINLNKLDCSIDNLHLCQGNSAHHLVHSSLQKCGYELFKAKKCFFNQEVFLYTIEPVVFSTNINLSEEEALKFREIKSCVTVNRGRPIEMCWKNAKINGKWETRNRPKHALMAEAFLKRRLYRNESVHHLDGDSTNNSLDNIVLMEQVAHQLAHSSLEKVAVSFLGREVIFDKKQGLYKLNPVFFSKGKSSSEGEGDGGSEE